MCDGSTRVLSKTIDGAVWSKLVTPAGVALPAAFLQIPENPGTLPIALDAP